MGGGGGLRVGVVGADTSHVVAFTRRIQHRAVDPGQWVDGARVVALCPLPSRILPREAVQAHVDAVAALGVTVVSAPGDLLPRVDAVFVETREAALHPALASLFLDAGVPVFVDQPFALTVSDAAAMVELAARRGVALVSSSSLRTCREARAMSRPRPQGARVHAPTQRHEANPGLMHYGMHGVELLAALMGQGVAGVACVGADGADELVLRWRDGRLATMRGLATPPASYRFTVERPEGAVAVEVDTDALYRDLLVRVLPALAGGPPPATPEAMVETVAVLTAANASLELGGREIALDAP